MGKSKRKRKRKCKKFKRFLKYLCCLSVNEVHPEQENSEEAEEEPVTAVTVSETAADDGSSENILKKLSNLEPFNWQSIQTGQKYYVHDEVLDDNDLKTLKPGEWLDDKVINAFLAVMMREQNCKASGHCYVLPSYIAELWKIGIYDNCLYKQIRFSNYEWIFMPINVRSSHWILMAVNVPEKTVHILDSLCKTPNTDIFKMWSEFMLIRSLEVGELGDGWNMGQLFSSRQKDGSSCGVFTVLNASALLQRIDLRNVTQSDADAMRFYICTKVMAAAKEPPEQRTTCDMLDCHGTSTANTMVKCEICGRWCHFACVNIQHNPEDFICPICEAQY